MHVEELTALGRFWYSEVYASGRISDRNEALVYANNINYKLAEADLSGIELRPGYFRNNWREPMVYLNGSAYAYNTLSSKLSGCTVNWMRCFLNSRWDTNQIGGDLYRYKQWLQLLAVIVCVAEVGRGMTLAPESLAEILEEENSWKSAFKRFVPVLGSAADGRTDWTDD